MDYGWEKIHFPGLVKDAKSVAGFSASSDGMTSHKHGLASKYSFKMADSEVEFWTSFETNLFMIAGTLDAETSVMGKAKCADKKVCFLE